MSAIGKLARRTPGVVPVYRALKGLWGGFRRRWDPTRTVFTDIWREGAWGRGESISGPGSDVEQTRAIRAALPALLAELEVRTLLDLPCGDFHWMSRVPLEGVRYLGADIVAPLVRENARRHAGEGREFLRLDLLRDDLPAADLVLCRDCLVHLAFADVARAFDNLVRSGATYLLTTHFPATEHNEEIRTGDWRALNLEAAPFHFPPPLEVLPEECTLEDGAHADKVLALWRLEDLAAPDARWRACARGGSSS